MWNDALNEFIKPYLLDKDVDLILLVGSYAVNNNNQYSDIDVYIMLNDDVDYQERGNKLIDNYLIEYFVNPRKKVLEYIEKDKNNFGGVMADMLVHGKVIYDRNNCFDDLRKIALNYKNLRHDKDIIKYYHAWCMYDEYKASKYHNDMQYYFCLKIMIDAYLYNHNYPLRPADKYERVFKDKDYCKNAGIRRCKNKIFNDLVIKCFDNKCDINLENLYNYIIKDGKFDINNFKYRNNL